jgi:Cu/Ag efflux protein CusF
MQMKFKIKNQTELDQFIEENNVDIIKSKLDEQLQSFDKIDDLELGLKNGVMIF